MSPYSHLLPGVCFESVPDAQQLVIEMLNGGFLMWVSRGNVQWADSDDIGPESRVQDGWLGLTGFSPHHRRHNAICLDEMGVISNMRKIKRNELAKSPNSVQAIGILHAV